MTDTAALEAAVKKVGPVNGLAYAVGSIPLKTIKLATADDFMQVWSGVMWCVWCAPSTRVATWSMVALCSHP